MSESERYRQLALFSLIVAEVVVTPVALGGLVFWLAGSSPFRTGLVAGAGLLGLVLAFYRISRMVKGGKADGGDRK